MLGQQLNDSLYHYYNILYHKNNKISTDYFKTYQFYIKHKDYSLQNKDTLNAIYDLRHLTYIEEELGLYNESESTATAALKFIDQFPNDSLITANKVAILNNIAIANKNLNNYNRALEVYKRALKHNSSIPNEHTIKNNIGSSYLQLGKYTKALEYLKSASEYFSLQKDTIKYARSLNSIGVIYFQT